VTACGAAAEGGAAN